MAASDFFSEDFTSAREKFVRAGQALGRVPRSFGKSVFGQPLAETVWLGEEQAKRLLVVCGGNRPADVLCCSAIESGWLSEFGKANLPGDTALILIHHDAAPLSGGEENRGPDQVPHWEDDVLAKVEERYAKFARDHKLDAEGNPLPEADADATGFPADMLDELARKLVRSDCQSLAVLDLRVGLGPFGEAEVSACHRHGSAGARRVAKWFGQPEPEEEEQRAPQQADSIAAGLTRRVQVAELTAATVEFGTYSMKSVLDNLGRDADDKPKHDRRRQLHPRGDDWKEAVWQNAIVAIQRALTGLQR